MTTQTKIGIRLDQQLAIDRAVRIVTGHAAFAHRFVLENKRARLLAMTLRAAFVLSRHRQTTSGFENVRAVRVMALHAIHFVFENGMMMRQLKFRVRFEMAFETRAGIFMRIDDELSSGRSDMFAAGAVARFATGSAGQLLARKIEMDPRMNAAGKFPRDGRVTIGADIVADVSRAGNFERSHDG
jgi:hypothetical protein